MRRYIAIIVVGLICIPFFMRKSSGPAAAQAPAADPTKLIVKSTPGLTADDLASIVGVQSMKMQIEFPAGAKSYKATLDLHGTGVADAGTKILIFQSGPEPLPEKSHHMDVLVAYMPVDYDGQVADKLKFVITLAGGDGVSTMSHIIPNPFKDLMMSSGVPEPESDGVINLIGGYKLEDGASRPLSKADRVISLRFKFE